MLNWFYNMYYKFINTYSFNNDNDLGEELILDKFNSESII